MQTAEARGSIDEAELRRFEQLARDWWNPDGQFAPLHRMNPVRIAFIRDRLAAIWGRDPMAMRPLSGRTIVDIGCGGGLLAEPLARLGATVTGIDAGPQAIAVARLHGGERNLGIEYLVSTAEQLAADGRTFDAVIASEVVEHVAEVPAFLGALSRLAKPGAPVVLSTLNRTWRSFALAIVGAEYVVRWLPRGTHSWRRFPKPSELAAGLRQQGLRTVEVAGMAYDPIGGTWRLAPRDPSVNYLLLARKLG